MEEVKKERKPSAWVSHCKEYAKKNGCNYRTAMVDGKASYLEKKNKGTKTKKVTKVKKIAKVKKIKVDPHKEAQKKKNKKR
jgi:hypothetical protein